MYGHERLFCLAAAYCIFIHNTTHKPATNYSPGPPDVSTVVRSPTGSTNSKEILKATEKNESKVYHSKWISYAIKQDWGMRLQMPAPFSRGSCSD